MLSVPQLIEEVKIRPPLYNTNCEQYKNRELKRDLWFEVCEIVHPDWESVHEDDRENEAKEVAKKWKNLRDAFVKDYSGKNNDKVRPYIHGEEMKFLVPILEAKGLVKSNLTTVRDTDVKNASRKNKYDTFLKFNPSKKRKLIKTSNEQRSQMSEEQPSPSVEYTQDFLDLGRNSNSFSGSENNDVLQPTMRKFMDLLSQSVSSQLEERKNDRFGNRSFLMSFLPVMDNLPPHLHIEARLQISQVFKELMFQHHSDDFPFPVESI